MKKILITGAAGAFGKIVVAHLNTLNSFDTISLVRSSVKEIKGEIVGCDLCDTEQITTALHSIQPDYILHLAATYANSIEEAYKVNVEPAHQILDAPHTSHACCFNWLCCGIRPGNTR